MEFELLPTASGARTRAAAGELRRSVLTIVLTLGAMVLLDWEQALPEELATVVGEGGHRLTVTQAQQLAVSD